MRVLMTTDAVGGVWTFTKELATGLLSKDISVTLVCLGPAPSAAQRSWARKTEAAFPGFHFHSLPVPLEWMQSNGLAFAQAVDPLLRIAAQTHPDLFHANQFCFGALPLRCPCLVTAHSDVLSWAEACHRAPLEETAWLATYRALVSAGLQGAAMVTAPTAWMLEQLGLHFALPSQRHAVPNGIRPLAARNPASPRRLRAVTAGRLWDEAKGIAVLRERSTWPLPIVLAGETRGENGGDAQLLQASFPPVLHWLGPVEHASLRELLENSAIYLCPSLYEPFGLAALEAGTAGCAIVARDLPSLREVWGGAALFFAGAGQLQAVLSRLVAEPSTLRAAQLAAGERASQFSSDRMVATYAALYGQLCDPGLSDAPLSDAGEALHHVA